MIEPAFARVEMLDGQVTSELEQGPVAGWTVPDEQVELGVQVESLRELETEPQGQVDRSEPEVP